MNKDDDSKTSPLGGGAILEEFRKNDDAGGGEGKKGDFADTTHTNKGSLKRSGQSQSDIRNLQQELFDLSRENDVLKEILERIQRESVPKRGKNNTSGGDDAKIEEVMNDLQLKQQLPKDAPQIAPLSDCDDTSNEQEVPRTIDISDRSGGSGEPISNLDLSNPSDRENDMEGQPKQEKKQFNYCRTESEGEIDYFQIYS